MGLGPGDHEVRKLQATGGSTYTLSLPKPWVVEFGLEPRDSLRVDWRPSGALRITPLNEHTRRELHAYFDHSRLPENSLHDHLMGAYISGADVIKISFEETNHALLARSVRRFLKSTRGFEIVDEQARTMELRCLLNAADMPLHASLNRMYLLVTSLMRDIINVFEGGDAEFLNDADERESEVDALLYLIERQTRLLLDSHAVASKLNLTRPQALEYANLAKSLERMMDHVHSISLFTMDQPQFVANIGAFPPLEHVPKWMGALKELMINIRTRDSVRIEEARHVLKSTQTTLKTYEQTQLHNLTDATDVAHALMISESVRRLCAYSRDFGEVLLNMKIAAEMTTVR
ncbi:MAG: PhoU domain-containing protein [Poseidonia sp.]